MPMAGKLMAFFTQTLRLDFLFPRQQFTKFNFKIGFWDRSCVKFGRQQMFYCNQCNSESSGHIKHQFSISDVLARFCT
jgi:hypothetical protein